MIFTNRNISRWTFLTLIAILVGIQIFQHVRASYAFPTPWPDESYFLWQAVGLAEQNTLFSHVLNPDRSIFWMPPGYMILTGLLFKLTGVSLAAARAVSFVSMVVSFLLLAAIIRRYPLSHLSLILIALPFLDECFVGTGNVARPDALLLAVVVFASFLLIRGRPWAGLAVMIMSPLVHPSGLLFAVVFGAYVGILLWRNQTPTRLSKVEWLLFLIAAAFWIAYAVYALLNLQDFMHDMQFQFGRKSGRDLLGINMNIDNLVQLTVVVALIVYCSRSKLKSITLMTIAIPAWLMFPLGNEMWYEMYRGIAIGLFSFLILQSGYHLLITRFSGLSKRVAFPLLGSIMILLLAWNRSLGTIPPLDHLPDRLQWKGMTIPGSVPYITQTDIATVGGFIKSHTESGDKAKVQFLPRADAFLFPDVLSHDVPVVHPLFCEIPADLYIIHRSRYIPSWWRFYIEEDLKKIGRSSLEEGILLLSRDSTEEWYALTPAEPTRSNLEQPDEFEHR